jgi:nucleoside-diphosphate-sugar epimerase
MRVLVIGGAGFIGRRIVSKLVSGGNDVTIFARRNPGLESRMQAEVLTGDRSDRPGFRGSLKNRSFDAVIDLAAYNRGDIEASMETFANATGHYLFCSSGAIYHDYPDWDQFRPVEEGDARLDWKDDCSYCEGKREAEFVLWSMKEEARPFPFTVIRPTVVEGPGDLSGRTWYWIQRIADGKPVLIPQTSPSAVFNHAYVDDVAEIFLKCVLNPSAFGQAYNVAGKEILTLDDYVGAIAESMNLRPEVRSGPLAWIREQEGLAEFVGPFVTERFVMSIDKAGRELGYSPTPLAKWLKPAVRWFLEEYHGPDSNGYDKRNFEVEGAEALNRRPG